MAEISFTINGREYPLPTSDTFSMGEAMVLYEYSGLTIDQLEDVDGFHPGVIMALVHIAYARGNPGAKKAKVREIVEAMNIVEIAKAFEDVDEAEEPASEEVPPRPPDQATPPSGTPGSEPESGG